MTRFLISTLALGLLLVGRAHAQENDVPYQFEAGLQVGQIDNDFTILSITLAGINAYFTQVTPEDQPVLERPFMQQAGYLTVFGGSLTLEDQTPAPFPDLDGTIVTGELLLASKDIPIGIGFVYQLITVDGTPTDTEISSTSGDLWLFLGSHSALILGGGLGKFELVGNPLLAGDISEEEEFHVRFKRVQRLGGAKWVNMEFGVTASSIDDLTVPAEDPWENTEVFFQFDVWVNPYVGVGAGLRVNSGDDDPLKSDLSEQGTTVGIRAALNAGSKFGLSVSFETFSVKDDTVGEDETTVFLQVVARF